MGVSIVGDVLCRTLAGLGLVGGVLAKAAAWSWRPAMATQDGR